MRWLIVEDALRDRKGHWFEYLGAFARELRAMGDEATILADRSAEPFLVEQLNAQPMLPPSIWHRMSDRAGALRRYSRVPVHALQTYQAVKNYLQRGKHFDVIFVPTVLVHHLLGWTWLIKLRLKKMPGRVVLFFPNTPVRLDLKSGEPSWHAAPTAKLFHRLICSLRNEVLQGRVILGAETRPMRGALARLTGVPFTYFPHPVAPLPDVSPANSGRQPSATVTMASYGSARHEKGCDLLVAAVEEYSRRFPQTQARFVLQSVEGDAGLWRRLEGNSRVQLVPNYFKNGEYAQQLARTDVLLLPYRCSSYGLRVSRVVIEAMVHGIPVVTTRGTTLADQAGEFGAPVLCEDENVNSLVLSIREMEQDFQWKKQCAEKLKAVARCHFSVSKFRETLVPGGYEPARASRVIPVE